MVAYYFFISLVALALAWALADLFKQTGRDEDRDKG